VIQNHLLIQNARCSHYYSNDPVARKSKCGTTFMAALVDSGHVPEKNFPFTNFRTTDLRFASQAFGREPNA
jgi:hypothetical protein